MSLVSGSAPWAPGAGHWQELCSITTNQEGPNLVSVATRTFSHVTAGRGWDVTSHGRGSRACGRRQGRASRPSGGRAGCRPGASHAWLKRARNRFLVLCFNYKGGTVHGWFVFFRNTNKGAKNKTPTTKKQTKSKLWDIHVHLPGAGAWHGAFWALSAVLASAQSAAP